VAELSAQQMPPQHLTAQPKYPATAVAPGKLRPAIGAATQPRIVAGLLHSPGEPLDAGTRAVMQSRFRHDFSQVRIHRDERAAASARSADALAYTVGRHVVFGAGRYAPGTRAGKRLLAHELAHVVQQHSAGRTSPGGLRIHGSRSAFEHEAETAASLVSIGLPADVSGRVSELQLQCNGAGRKAGSAEQQVPAWTPAQLRVIQLQLKRLGLYRDPVGRKFGETTESGLVEAFGGDEWRRLAPAAIIKRLNAATPPKGKSKDHNLRYGELFKDGILDITLGVGFDESGLGRNVYDEIRKKLPAEGFEESEAKAKVIYKRTGHAPGASAFGMYFVWKNTLKYTPPAGPERKIAVVVRLVSDTDEKHGAEAAAAFEEGMRHSDISFYAGHGRFGSGPDFDRALKVTFLRADGTSRAVIDDYEQVEGELAKDVKSKDVDVLWKRFQWLLAHNLIKVEGENKGNIYLNQTDRHPSEFAARLMYWNLTRRALPGTAVPSATGKKGVLGRPAAEKGYRLWVFNGCRTQDYLASIRSTPGADPRSTDIVATRRTIYWSDYTDTIIAFMRSVLAQQSAEQIVREMDAANVTSRPAGKAGVAPLPSGMEDNPVIP